MLRVPTRYDESVKEIAILKSEISAISIAEHQLTNINGLPFTLFLTVKGTDKVFTIPLTGWDEYLAFLDWWSTDQQEETIDETYLFSTMLTY